MTQTKAQKEKAAKAKAAKDAQALAKAPEAETDLGDTEGAAPPAPEAPPEPKPKKAEKFNAKVALGRTVDNNQPGTKLLLKPKQLERLTKLGFVEALDR